MTLIPEPIPASGNISVYVGAGTHQISPQHPLPWAMVSPNRDSWNDYGFGYFADIWIADTSGQITTSRFRIMFDGYLRSVTALDAILAMNGGQPIALNAVTIPFVSLLPAMDDYKAVVEALGFDNGVSLLRELHDANVSRLEGTDLETLELIAREDFHIGILRSADTYEAFARGAKYLRPDTPAELAEVSGTYDFTAKLPNADEPHVVEFEFTPDAIFNDRACILIGRNGVGKTQLLKSVVDALNGSGSDSAKFEPKLDVSRVLVFSSVTTDPFPLSIPPWRGIDYEYFAINASTRDRPASLVGSLLTCWQDRPAGPPGARWSRHSVLLGMLKLLGIEGRLFLPIRPIQGGDTLPYTMTVGERLYFPFSANMNEQNTLKLSHRLDWDAWPVVLGDDLQPRALSSGEHALLRLSAQMAASVETGSLLLLDEPETHLHPNYISVLMSVVHSLLDKTNSAAIIATHSAYIVREVGKTKVNVLSVENRIPDCGRPLMQTFGASIDSISQFVFGDSDQTHRFQQSLEKWLAGGAADRGIDALVQEYAGHLNSEALSLVARLIREPNDGG